MNRHREHLALDPCPQPVHEPAWRNANLILIALAIAHRELETLQVHVVDTHATTPLDPLSDSVPISSGETHRLVPGLHLLPLRRIPSRMAIAGTLPLLPDAAQLGLNRQPATLDRNGARSNPRHWWAAADSEIAPPKPERF